MIPVRQKISSTTKTLALWECKKKCILRIICLIFLLLCNYIIRLLHKNNIVKKVFTLKVSYVVYVTYALERQPLYGTVTYERMDNKPV